MSPLMNLWCRLAHAAFKSFSLPTPHPKGQQFRVKCRKCGNAYNVVTPDGWTSPWKAGARIVHPDYEDPVHEYQGQWHFWDSQRQNRQGPFVTEVQARAAYKKYYAEEGDKMTMKLEWQK